MGSKAVLNFSESSSVLVSEDFPKLGGTFLCFVIHMRTLQSPTYAYIGRTLKDVFLEVVFFD